MRKLPLRPEDRQITQPYRDGVVKIYTITDAAQPGYQPKPTPTLMYELGEEHPQTELIVIPGITAASRRRCRWSA